MTSSSFPVMKVESKEEMKKSGDIKVIDRHATKRNPSFLTIEAFVCFPLDHVMCCLLRMTSFTPLQFTRVDQSQFSERTQQLRLLLGDAFLSAPVSMYNLV